jgi:hypothetical protein
LGKKTAKTAKKQGKKEVISTHVLDLLIMAIIVVLVANLIYPQEK